MIVHQHLVFSYSHAKLCILILMLRIDSSSSMSHIICQTCREDAVAYYDDILIQVFKHNHFVIQSLTSTLVSRSHGDDERIYVLSTEVITAVCPVRSLYLPFKFTVTAFLFPSSTFRHGQHSSRYTVHVYKPSLQVIVERISRIPVCFLTSPRVCSFSLLSLSPSLAVFASPE